MSPAVAKKVTGSLPDWVDLEQGVSNEKRLWLRARREAAVTALTERGFPSVADEEWKYTSIAALYEQSFRPDQEAAAVLPRAQTDELGISLEQGPELVFVNGIYHNELSRLEDLPHGVRILSMREALDFDDAILQQHLAKYCDVQSHPFAALNTANFIDGALILLEEGAVLENPIHLHYIAHAPEEGILIQPRNLIVAGKNSRGTIVESYVGFAGQQSFTNVVTELVLGESAQVEHYKLQNESEQAFHVAALHAEQQQNSFFQQTSVSFGAALARYNVNVRQDAEGADCSLNGLCLVMDSQHVDSHVRVDHLKPHGTSNLLFKGVLDQKGRAVFNGKVIVHEGASKTIADQTNNNLLLSDQAEVDPKPELEIYHNDVKCSHGATVGQLDEQALFYLRSRGIALAEALQILTLAFAKQVLEKIKATRLEAYSECQLIQRLGGLKHE